MAGSQRLPGAEVISHLEIYQSTSALNFWMGASDMVQTTRGHAFSSYSKVNLSAAAFKVG